MRLNSLGLLADIFHHNTALNRLGKPCCLPEIDSLVESTCLGCLLLLRNYDTAKDYNLFIHLSAGDKRVPMASISYLRDRNMPSLIGKIQYNDDIPYRSNSQVGNSSIIQESIYSFLEEHTSYRDNKDFMMSNHPKWPFIYHGQDIINEVFYTLHGGILLNQDKLLTTKKIALEYAGEDNNGWDEILIHNL